MPVCITFDPDPEVVLRPQRPNLALSTTAERIELLTGLGVEHVEVVPFTRHVSLQGPEEFVDSLQAKHRLRSLWVGADFALGRDRTGTVDALRAIGQHAGFEVFTVEPLTHEGQVISATWIRQLLAEGRVDTCAELLGRPYCIGGVVVSGMRRGRDLGFPTANVVPPTSRALPADGVYFVRVPWRALGGAVEAGDAEWCYGVVNLGGRPTFDETERLLETHLLDFEGELYGTRLSVCFLRQLRQVQRFPSPDALRAQLERDVATARSLLEGESGRQSAG